MSIPGGMLFVLDAGRAPGLQLLDVELDLLLRVRGQVVEADAEIAAVTGAQVRDLAGQVQARRRRAA